MPIQLSPAYWDGRTGRTYTLYGVADDGLAYIYSLRRDRWEPIGTGKRERVDNYA